jgi:hypothetical protein
VFSAIKRTTVSEIAACIEPPSALGSGAGCGRAMTACVLVSLRG